MTGYMLRATADYALIGLVLDAATKQQQDVLQRRPLDPSLSFRVRF